VIAACFLSGEIVYCAQPIKLGAVLPLGDITGRQGSKAMQLAVKEINASGGVLGRPLELIVVDDEMKPEKGAAAIDKLATVDKVDVFVGGMASGVHLAQIPILKKYKKVTVWAGAASSRCEAALKGQDWYFHIHTWDYMQGQGYVDGWTAMAKKDPRIKVNRWFLAYEEGAFGAGTYRATKPLLPGGWTVEGTSFKSAAHGGGDYRAVLRRAKEYKPDLFMWIGYDHDAFPIMEQTKEVGFAPPIFVGSPPGWPANYGKSRLSDGVVLYGAWAPSIKSVNKVSRKFFDGYVKEYREEPATYFAPLCYANIYIVAEGIRRTGSLETNRLIAGLEKTNYLSPLGETITFTPSRIIKHQGLQRQKILQYQKGKQQVIWPFEYATAKLIYPFKLK